MRVGLVGAELGLLLVALHFCVGLDVGFLHRAERADDRQWHLPHLQARRHRIETALEGEIHQSCMDEVILMVPEGYLIAAELLSEVEHFFAALPGAEEAWLLLPAQAGGGFWRLLWHSSMLNHRRSIDLEAGIPYVEPDAEGVAELLQIARVALVVDVLHPYVQGLDLELWVMDLRALRQEFRQKE